MNTNPPGLLLTKFSEFLTELNRNLVGLLLIGTGVGVIIFGAHWHMPELVTLGTATLVPAALLALQSKRTPDAPPPGGATFTQETMATPPATPTPIPQQEKIA